MNKIRKLLAGFVAALIALAALPAFATDLTTDQVYQLNKRFSPSVAAKVQLGTAISNAENTVGKFADAVLLETTGTLSQANITGMNSAAVTLIAAAGAGKLIILDEVEIFHDYATAAYTTGGDVTIEYATSGVDLLVLDVALVTAAADANYVFKVGDSAAAYATTASTASAADLSTSANKAVVITNATAAFAAGNASNVIKYRIRYHVVTLQT